MSRNEIVERLLHMDLVSENTKVGVKNGKYYIVDECDVVFDIDDLIIVGDFEHQPTQDDIEFIF